MPLFDVRHKLKIHILQIILIHIIIGVTAPRLFMKGQPRTRANTIALGMGGKSLVIIFYQILTEHVARFRRWRSLKANAILNALEIVFWAAVVFLTIQANVQICVGVGCTLSWVTCGVAAVTTVVAVYMAIISYVEFRGSRPRQAPPLSRKIPSEAATERSMDNLVARRA